MIAILALGLFAFLEEILFVVAVEAKPHTIQGLIWRELTPAEVAAGSALAKSRGKTLFPPSDFDYFNPDVKIIAVPKSQVPRVCSAYRKGSNSIVPPLACAIMGSPCIIVLPKGDPLSVAILRHEMGHCNGWRHPVLDAKAAPRSIK